MDSLTIIWVIVCAYLLLNLLVGVYCHIRVKDSTDYLLAGRRIGVLYRKRRCAISRALRSFRIPSMKKIKNCLKK